MFLLLTKKVSILEKYIDFSDIFFKKSAAVLFSYLEINKHIIDLEPDKQPYYRLIYSLGLVKLKIFNIYIKANLINNFIQSFKSLKRAPIFMFRSLIEASVCI